MSVYYTITYIHRGETTERTLYLPGDSTYCLLSATLTLSAGASGTLELEIPESNPAFTDLQYMTDEVIFYRRGVELWRGRPVTVETDFNRTGTLTVEGALSYLYDTWYPPYDYSGSPTGLLQSVLDNHNDQVPEDRQLQLGTVTVTDANDYIARSNQDYSRSLNVLTDKLVGESLGGYLRVRVSGGVRYLDYLQSYDTTAAQTIQLGVNLLDIARTVDYGDLATVLLPLGARDEESGEQLTVESVNGGSVYVEDADAVATYGRIVASNTWDDVTVADNLLTKAKAYLAQLTSAVQQVTVSAVDLALVSETEVAISLGDAVLIQSTPHGVNQYFDLTEMTIHPLSPGEDTLTFGADASSMTEQQSQSSRSVQADIASLAVQLTKVVATYITADYLSANYATITDLTAVQADITDLKAADAEITNLVATKADVTDLTAAQADISNLTADTANIKSILAGNVGTGTLQAIHLTGENLVADDAIITDAMIASLTASKLTAGTIYTSLINIASDEDEHLLLDGAGLQLKDGAGTVRVQIGQDGAGDYNLSLWDASGALLWDASGVYAAGLHDGIIRDIAVAEDAAISGSKLDIASVAQRLNEDGSITVDAANVTIDETTLDVAYKTVTDNTDAATTAAAAAKQAADDAAAAATAAQTTATAAQTAAATAQSTADAAAAEAANAQTAADQAAANATAAQTAADTAKADAAAAQTAADTAATEAANAQAAADQAQADYDALALRADATEEELAAAQTALTQAQADATAAQTAATAAQSTADTAKANAATAQTAADAAAQDAATAQSTADTAKTAAATAQSTADTAKADAATAQAAAEAAQATADQAAADYTGLETRTTTLETNLTVVQGQISSKVWQTDITEITDPMGADITTLEDNYSSLIQTVDGLTSTVGSVQTTVNELTLAIGTVYEGTSSTAATAYYKTVTVTEGTFTLEAGAAVIVTFSRAHTASSLYLNVASTGNKRVYKDGAAVSSSNSLTWSAGDAVAFVYDGSYWQYIESAEASSSVTLAQRLLASSVSEISQTADSIQLSVTALESTTDELSSNYSTLSQTVDSISLNVSSVQTTVTEQGESITDINAQLALKVGVNDNDQVVSMLNASADEITITGNRLVITSDNFTLAADGTLTAANANITGTITGSTISGSTIYCGSTATVGSVTAHAFEVTSAGHLYALSATFGETLEMVNSEGTITTIFSAGTSDDMGWILSPGGILFGDNTAFGSSVDDMSFYYNHSMHRLYCLPSGSAESSYYLGRNGDLSISSLVVANSAAVSGSLSTYGYTVPRMQHGSISVTAAGSSVTAFSVTFPKTFAGTPDVILTLRHGSTTRLDYKVKTVSTSGFTADVYNNATSSGTVVAYWLAIY